MVHFPSAPYTHFKGVFDRIAILTDKFQSTRLKIPRILNQGAAAAQETGSNKLNGQFCVKELLFVTAISICGIG
jgi:hypothetical protein